MPSSRKCTEDDHNNFLKGDEVHGEEYCSGICPLQSGHCFKGQAHVETDYIEKIKFGGWGWNKRQSLAAKKRKIAACFCRMNGRMARKSLEGAGVRKEKQSREERLCQKIQGQRGK